MVEDDGNNLMRIHLWSECIIDLGAHHIPCLKLIIDDDDFSYA